MTRSVASRAPINLKIARPLKSLEKTRPRLFAGHDFSHRISAAGLLHLKKFMAQRALFMSKRSAESVHQMRVAIRRLRTVISVLSCVTSDETYQNYNHTLKDFARILGHGRDQDIFIAMLQQIPSSFHHDLDLQERAVYDIIAVRDKAYLQIDHALQDRTINKVFEDLSTVFQLRSYSIQRSFTDASDIDALILDDIYKKVLKHGRKLASQDLNQRHRLRISLKNLRYALEFLALDRSPDTSAINFGKLIMRLLSHLGAANDAFTASRIARDSLASQDIQIQMMAGMIAGWHSRAVRDNEPNLLKSWQKFKSLTPYWS